MLSFQVRLATKALVPMGTLAEDPPPPPEGGGHDDRKGWDPTGPGGPAKGAPMNYRFTACFYMG